MKIKVTKKEIIKRYKNIISAGYCDLDYLLRYREADFYTSGINGWNADIYKINNSTVIVTGYRLFGNIKSYEINEKYNKKASEIIHNFNLTYEQTEKKLDKLIEKFIEESIKENEI